MLLFHNHASTFGFITFTETAPVKQVPNLDFVIEAVERRDTRMYACIQDGIGAPPMYKPFLCVQRSWSSKKQELVKIFGNKLTIGSLRCGTASSKGIPGSWVDHADKEALVHTKGSETHR